MRIGTTAKEVEQAMQHRTSTSGMKRNQKVGAFTQRLNVLTHESRDLGMETPFRFGYQGGGFDSHQGLAVCIS